jgi:hypothetical protein
MRATVFAPKGSRCGQDREIAYTLGAPIATAVEPIASELPSEFALMQSYPNPFNPTATITFSVPMAERVTVTIFDLLGRQVVTLVDERLVAGNYAFEFEAGDLPSGTYVYRMTAGSFKQARTMTLLK